MEVSYNSFWGWVDGAGVGVGCVYVRACVLGGGGSEKLHSVEVQIGDTYVNQVDTDVIVATLVFSSLVG